MLADPCPAVPCCAAVARYRTAPDRGINLAGELRRQRMLLVVLCAHLLADHAAQLGHAPDCFAQLRLQPASPIHCPLCSHLSRLQLVADYEAKLGPAPDSVRAFFTNLAE